MSNYIINGAPMVIDYATQDVSIPPQPRVPEAIPQHLPKFFLFTQKGPEEEQLVVGAERDRIFGTESFNEKGKYCNYATIFANAANAEGNACMIKRLVPADAGPRSNIVVWLDVLPTTVDLYERNTDGSIKLDQYGDPIITGTAPGHKVKWVVTNRATRPEEEQFGQETQTNGDQVDPVSSVQSTRYPIFELQASSRGEDANNAGIRIWAPIRSAVNALPTKLMNDERVYPYYISVVRRQNALSTAKISETIFGEQNLMMTFKPDTVDPLTDRQIFIGDNFIQSYENRTDPRYPEVFGDFGRIAIYQQNIDTLLAQFQALELPFLGIESDMTADPEDRHLFNFITGVESSGAPYHSFVFVDSPSTVRWSEYTNVYARGGSDGTMDNATFATLVEEEMQRYLDRNDEVMDLAYHVESHFYDPGYPLSTKLELANALAIRKDTMVVVGTHSADEPIQSAADEHARAISIRTRLRMYPESDYFGTPVMRAIIIGRSGRIRNSLYRGHLPLTYEVLKKSARYMGASDGAWRNGAAFDIAPGNVIDDMYDINIKWVPAQVRNRNWDVGLNWVQRYQRNSFQFPALKTIYSEEGSVLNNYLTACAIGQINKVVHRTWREFTGSQRLTNAQLADRVNSFVIENTNKRFDDTFEIRPDAHFTDLDVLRGFSWTLPVKIGSPGMKTVMTTYVQAYRIEDLAGQ